MKGTVCYIMLYKMSKHVQNTSWYSFAIGETGADTGLCNNLHHKAINLDTELF